MIKKLLISSAVLSMLLTGSAYACGESGHKGHNSEKSAHNSHGKHEKMHLVRKVVAAVSKTGLTTDQVSKVTEAINIFKAIKQEVKQSKKFPIDAIKDDKFDSDIFLDAKSQMFKKKIMAVNDMFTTIYSVLTPEQRKVFKREFTAPIVQKMIKKGMAKGHKKQNSCH